MKPTSLPEFDKKEEKVIQLLKELGSFHATYPPELLKARREAFLAEAGELTNPNIDEEFSAEEQEIVQLLGALRSAWLDYPPHLLAARRSALLDQLDRAENPSLFDRLHASLQRITSFSTATPTLPRFRRTALVIASLIAAALFGSFLLRGVEQAFTPSFLQGAAAPTSVLPTGTDEVALTLCKSEYGAHSCLPGEVEHSRDLANSENGMARPAVSNDGGYQAARVNDGRDGASWVSNQPDSWIKIDLGQVSIINTVSLLNASAGASGEKNPGQFVIAVALADVYSDGDSSNDDVEYAQVFHSWQTGFSGAVSQADTIQTQFSPVQARYVKITFESAGAAIEEVGVFMVEPPEQPTRTPHGILDSTSPTPSLTNTPSFANTITSITTGTSLPVDTVVPTHTEASSQADTPTPLSTNTLPPPDTATPVPTEPLPTVIPPTEISATIQPPPVNSDPIIVTGNGQTLTFVCNGNAVEVKGHEHTVTLLGSCSSISVTGNNNRIFWESGSPVITNQGKDNIITQL